MICCCQWGNSMKNLGKALLLGMACAAVAFAQDYRATILGQITDPSGATVPNALVKATRLDNNQSVEARSSADGVYSIPFLNPGTYRLEASAPGFATMRRESVVLQTADKLNIPLKLQVGDVSQEITVVGEQETIDTGTASRGLNFDPIKTQEYPLNGRQTYMLLALTPGVIFTQEQFGATDSPGHAAGTSTTLTKSTGAVQARTSSCSTAHRFPTKTVPGSWRRTWRRCRNSR